MTRYQGVSEGSGAVVVGPYLKYRAVLDEARTWAQRAVTNVVIMNVETGEPEAIVRPDGRIMPPNPRYRP